MLNIVLVEPEIPQNTGNIARTCAVTGANLHIIRPIAFDISDKAVKRAGLDYWHLLSIYLYRNVRHFFEINGDSNIWLATTKADTLYTQAHFTHDAFILFGKETAGLPQPLRHKYPHRCIRIPMRPALRSLNLSNSVAILTFEALRQQGFPELL